MANMVEQRQKKGFPHLLAAIMFGKVKTANNSWGPVFKPSTCSLHVSVVNAVC